MRDTLKPRSHSHIPIPSAEIQDDYAAASNLFDSLKIEELSGGLSSSLTPTETLQDEHHESEEQFVAEEVKTAQERYLAAHCLFRDIAKIREFAGKIWSVGAFDLMNCAVATNTAIDLARQAQHDFEKEFGMALDYKEVAGRFYAVQGHLQGVDPSKRASAGDPINFEAAGIANFVMFPVYILLSSFKNVLSDNHIPISKPGFFGTYDPNSDRSKKSARERFEEDKIILMEMLANGNHTRHSGRRQLHTNGARHEEGRHH